jgi:hypothetical protein
MKITLDQDKLSEIQNLLNLFPIKYLPEVQKIVEILNSGLEQVVEDVIKK